MYGVEHRKLQDEFDARRLADRVRDVIVSDEINESHIGFISSRDMFFLTTITHEGQPTVSYKGGSPGLLQVLDSKTIAFPSYDGNGMFLTAGNIIANENIGMLLIDFETPFRVRIQGKAKRTKDPELMKLFHEAQLVFKVTVNRIWINCNRYIHPHKRLENSKYVPKVGEKTPYPSWKRIDLVNDALPYDEADKVEEEGGQITIQDWMGKIQEKDA